MTEAQDRREVGVFTTDASLVIGSWDIWMARASGIPEEHARGKSLLQLFPDIESRGLSHRLRAVIERGTVDILAPAFHQYLVRCPTSEGAPYFAVMQQHVTVSPLREQGRSNGLIITVEDVTARCVRERRLAEQLKSDDEAIRLRATRELSQSSTPPIDALGDSSWQVRRAAVSSIAETTSTDAIAQLVDLIRDKHTDLATLNASLSALTLAKRDSLPVMVGLLDSDDANIRMYTALALGNMRDARALPSLLPLLDDPDANVRYHVVEALGRIAAVQAVEPLLQVVRQRDPYVSFAALDALAAIGEPSAMPEVISLLDDPLLAPAAIDALAAVGNEHAAGPLVDALSDGAPPPAVCNALASIHERLHREFGEGDLIADVVRKRVDAGAASTLIASIPSATDSELPGVARVLGWLPFDGVESVLCGLLKHAPSRRNAQESLVVLGKRAVPALLRELQDATLEVRQAAAGVLGRIGGADSVGHLARLLDENEPPELLVTATAALGSLGSPDAFEALLPMLGHRDAAVRHASVAAINSIAHPDTADRIRPLLSNRDSVVRESAVKIVGYFGFADCFDDVVALLGDENSHVRRAVVDHIPYFEDARNRQALQRGLRDADSGVRSAACRALANLSPEAADHLLDAPLEDPDPRVRYQAVQAVAAQRVRRLLPALRGLLANDSAMPVRIAAAIALGQLQDAEAVDLLKAAAAHPEADLACPAIAALGRMPRTDVQPVIHAALSGGEPRRQLAALDAIAGRSEFLPHVQQLAAEAMQTRVVEAALTALVASGDRAALEAVLELCARDDRQTECINALSKANAEDVGVIAGGLRHPDYRVRLAVVQALARMRSAAAPRELSVALQDQDTTVRFAAAQALGRFDLLQRPNSIGSAVESAGR